MIVIPLYLDREHPGRDQLRACRLPRGVLVDSSVCVVHGGDGPASPHIADFLLGLWNARVVEGLVCRGLLANASTWLTHAAIHALPFPVPDLATLLHPSRRPAGPTPGRAPQDLVWMVAESAAAAERSRQVAARAIAAWYRAQPQPSVALRASCWQALTACGPGGRAADAGETAALRGCIPGLVGALAEWDASVALCESAVASLYAPG